MRNAFAAELADLATRDARVVLLSGDIGNRLFDRYKEICAERFYNCGVAEGAMMSVAAGLAMCGLRPFVYTIAPFATVRCLEQIRVDVCYHHQPVVVVGTGAGLSYASLGGTHHSCEDIGMLRLLPDMAVVCPADAAETRAAVRAALSWSRPLYLRLGKKGEPAVHASEPDFEIGRAIGLRDGGDVCLLGVGNAVPVALEAAERLEQQGLSTRVASFHTIKPLDERLLEEVFDGCEVVATVEEHSVLGGAGGAVAEWKASHPQARARLVLAGTADRFLHEAGSQAHARAMLGLTPEAVAEAVLAEARR